DGCDPLSQSCEPLCLYCGGDEGGSGAGGGGGSGAGGGGGSNAGIGNNAGRGGGSGGYTTAHPGPGDVLHLPVSAAPDASTAGNFTTYDMIGSTARTALSTQVKKVFEASILAAADLVAGVPGMNYSSVSGPIHHRDDI